MKRVALLFNTSPGRVDGIRDYSLQLADALRRRGDTEVDLFGRGPTGTWQRRPQDCRRTREGKRLNSQIRGYDFAIVQYQAYMYGRWGLAPWLIHELWKLRLDNPEMTIALMVHEMYVRMDGVGQTIQGLWQRFQLWALRLSASVVLVSTEVWAQSLSKWTPPRPTFHLPVGSNLPDMRRVRADERQHMGISNDVTVLVCFDANRLNHDIDCIIESANGLVRSGCPVALLNLGAHAPRLEGLDERVQYYRPGTLPAAALASKLSTGDIFLAPFIEGFSSRRTTVMAALQHGLPVVTTEGPLTDPSVRNAKDALLLLPTGDRKTFVQSVRQLAEDRQARQQTGLTGRALYEEKYDWPGLANRLIVSLNSARAESMRSQSAF